MVRYADLDSGARSRLWVYTAIIVFAVVVAAAVTGNVWAYAATGVVLGSVIAAIELYLALRQASTKRHS